MYMKQQWIVISHDSRAVLLVVHGLIYVSAVSCDSGNWNSLDSPLCGLLSGLFYIVFSHGSQGVKAEVSTILLRLHLGNRTISFLLYSFDQNNTKSSPDSRGRETAFAF